MFFFTHLADIFRSPIRFIIFLPERAMRLKFIEEERRRSRKIQDLITNKWIYIDAFQGAAQSVSTYEVVQTIARMKFLMSIWM